MKKAILIEILVSLLVLLFLYASFSKYFDMHRYVRSMHNQPFPDWLATFFTWTIPPIEILIAALLIPQKTRLAGLYSSLTLMVLFTLYTSAILLHIFPNAPCACGGIIELITWKYHLLLNLFFVGISVGGIILTKNHLTTKGELITK